MNKLILIAFILLTSVAWAEDQTEKAITELPPSDTPSLISDADIEKEHEHFERRASHWLTSFGFEMANYEVPFDFRGAKKNFHPNDQQLSGGRLGFGGEIYLGKGFLTTSKVEGYYLGTLFTRSINAGPEETDVEFASTKKSGNLYGMDVSQSLTYLIDMKTKNPFMDEWTYLTCEPFIEAGIGKAIAYNSVQYQYLLSDVRENHREHVSDQILNARIGAGISFTSNTGFFLYIKATQNRYDVTDRKVRGASRPNGQDGETSLKRSDNDVKMDPVTIWALGGGYKF
jgi:hypothetical protein